MAMKTFRFLGLPIGREITIYTAAGVEVEDRVVDTSGVVTMALDDATGYYAQVESSVHPYRVDGITDASAGALAAPALNTAYEPSGKGAISGIRFIADGDSITEASSTALSIYGDWGMHLTLASGGQIVYTDNAGHSGYNSTDLAALFVSEVISQNPTLVVCKPGRNDPLSSTDLHELKAFCELMLIECRKIGAELVLMNATPQGNAALPIPAAPTVGQSTPTGGTVAQQTHRFVVTYTNINGETPASPVGSYLVNTATQRIRVGIPHVPGATGAKVYKETSDGSGVYGLVATNSTANSPAYFFNHGYTESAPSAPNAAITPPATNTTGAPTSRPEQAAAINAWMARWGADNGVIVVDVYTPITDAATGMYATGSIDGTHPVGETHALMGRAVWATIQSKIKPVPAQLSRSAADPFNLFPNPLNLASSGGIPTGVVTTMSPTFESSASHILRTVGPRAGFAGNAFRMEKVSMGGSAACAFPLITSGFSVGDRLLLAMMVETEGLAANGSLFLPRWVDQAAAAWFTTGVAMADYGPTPMVFERVVPAGMTAFGLISQISGKGAISLGQLTVYNLTTAAFLTP